MCEKSRHASWAVCMTAVVLLAAPARAAAAEVAAGAGSSAGPGADAIVGFDQRGAYLGEERRALESPAFYEAVGRPDLAASYRRTRAWRLALLVAGGAAVCFGGLWYLGQAAEEADERSHDADRLAACYLGGPSERNPACHPLRTSHDPMGPLMFVAGGGVAFLIGAFLNPEPVSPQARIDLAERHNRLLHERREPTAPIVPSAFVLPGGGGVRLSARF